MFVIFRILLVLFFAGSGYVDEGEYFDAVESAAGDAFDIQVVRTEQESKKLYFINLLKLNLSRSGSIFHRFLDNTNKWIWRILEFRKKILEFRRQILKFSG